MSFTNHRKRRLLLLPDEDLNLGPPKHLLLVPRHFHGPQRRRRPFGLRFAFAGDLRRNTPPPTLPEKAAAFDMGNYISRLFKERSRDGATEEELGLGVYRRWVEGSRDAGDLTVATKEEAEEPRVVSRRVGDARKAALEASSVRETAKRVPYYKEALEKARRHDGRLSELEFEKRVAEEKLAGLRNVAETPAKKPQEDLSELFTPLTDEEKNEVDNLLYGSGRSNKILVTHESSNIEVSTEKLRCLRSGGWLNDEVINLYLELLKERAEREPKRFLKCHFFNTFFYKKLASGKTGYDYRSVRRWTTLKKLGYGLIECEKIFVPVHKDIHWCLAIINMKEKTFQYLDSLGGMDRAVLRVLARYIMEEVKDKSNIEIDTSSWQEESVDSLPLQKNGWDCGVFMLKYIDFHSRGLRLSFSQEHMEYFRKRTAKEILRLRAD